VNSKEFQDKIALKELVDKVSIFGDKKDFQKQAQLFSKNAVSETFADGIVILKLKRRKEIAEAFSKFLKNFDTVYHSNSQQVVNIEGDMASAISYCQVTLIGNENGQKMKTKIGVVYSDNFVRKNNGWLIEKRIGDFVWQEKSEVGE